MVCEGIETYEDKDWQAVNMKHAAHIYYENKWEWYQMNHRMTLQLINIRKSRNWGLEKSKRHKVGDKPGIFILAPQENM